LSVDGSTYCLESDFPQTISGTGTKACFCRNINANLEVDMTDLSNGPFLITV
jgi:hypothetical protein